MAGGSDASLDFRVWDSGLRNPCQECMYGAATAPGLAGVIIVQSGLDIFFIGGCFFP